MESLNRFRLFFTIDLFIFFLHPSPFPIHPSSRLIVTDFQTFLLMTSLCTNLKVSSTEAFAMFMLLLSPERRLQKKTKKCLVYLFPSFSLSSSLFTPGPAEGKSPFLEECRSSPPLRSPPAVWLPNGDRFSVLVLGQVLFDVVSVPSPSDQEFESLSIVSCCRSFLGVDKGPRQPKNLFYHLEAMTPPVYRS